MMQDNPCYEKLRPDRIVKARLKCPAAYLPIGTIEWHGAHNPVGLDTLKIHKLAIKCAEQSGGLVFHRYTMEKIGSLLW